MDTIIITDSCCDLPLSYLQERNVPVIYYPFFIDDKECYDDLWQSRTCEEFFGLMRAGKVSRTSQVNPNVYYEMFEKYVKEGKAIIFLSFSSALTASFNNALQARDMLLEKYPDADITIIDTLSASLGEGLLVYYAVEMLHNGASKEEIIDWVETNKYRLHHWFTVESLEYLRRGGRVSGAKAFIGNVLDIKPLLHFDNKGAIVPVFKARGRKRAVRALVDKLEEYIVNPEEQLVTINHGDCLDEAKYVEQLIRERAKVKDILINPVGPVIGSHSGPGTLSVFFLAEKRLL